MKYEVLSVPKLRNLKAPGYDLITGEIIKNLPPRCIRLLTIMFNRILQTGWFPSQWKCATIITLLKPGKPSELASSYRPISLLPVLSKICEKLILARIRPILEENKTLPDHQFGFRFRHSSVDQLHRVTNTITYSLERKEYCCAAFLDVQAAFDKVWIDGLLYKLRRILPEYLYKVMTTYLHNRYLQIRVGNATSEFREVRAGVPQGSVLGPTLYALYTADIPEPTTTTLGTFADDTVYLTSDANPVTAANRLQNALTELENWIHKWRTKINPNKSEYIVFTLNKSIPPPVLFEGEPIPWTDTAKYLGMHLDSKLTWRAHINKKITELKIKRSKIHWLLNRNSALSLENKLLLYKMILKPVWMYGAHIWWQACKSNINKVQVFQNETLRLITGAPLFTTVELLHSYTEIAFITEAIQKSASVHADHLEDHDNQLAINLLDNSNDIL